MALACPSGTETSRHLWNVRARPAPLASLPCVAVFVSALLSLQSYQVAASQWDAVACDPSCVGGCFAGRCLFRPAEVGEDFATDDVLSETRLAQETPLPPVTAPVGHAPDVPLSTGASLQLAQKRAIAVSDAKYLALAEKMLAASRPAKGASAVASTATSEFGFEDAKAPLASSNVGFEGLNLGEIGDRSKDAVRASSETTSDSSSAFLEPIVPFGEREPAEVPDVASPVAMPAAVQFLGARQALKDKRDATISRSRNNLGTLPPGLHAPAPVPWLHAPAPVPAPPSLSQRSIGAELRIPTTSEFMASSRPISGRQLPPSARQNAFQERGGANSELSELAAENKALQQELDNWRSAGALVAGREARVVELIRQSKGDAPLQTESADKEQIERMRNASSWHIRRIHNGSNETMMGSFLTHGSELVETYVEKEGIAWAVAMPSVVFVCAVMLCLLSMRLVPSNREDKYRKALSRTNSRNLFGGSQPLAPILREAGIGSYVIEVSEIQVHGLLSGGDVCVALQMGQGRELRTRPQELQIGQMLLRFAEVFVANVNKYEEKGKFVLWIVDRHGVEDARIAKLEITVPELLRMVHHVHGEYFQFELHVLNQCWHSKFQKWSSHRSDHAEHQLLNVPTAKPHVAMRIRDITGLPVDADALAAGVSQDSHWRPGLVASWNGATASH